MEDPFFIVKESVRSLFCLYFGSYLAYLRPFMNFPFVFRL